MKDVLKTAEAALAALRENGADMAGVVAAYTETREFNVDGGQFSLLRTLFDDSLSLAGYRQGRKGTAMINRFDDGSIRCRPGMHALGGGGRAGRGLGPGAGTGACLLYGRLSPGRHGRAVFPAAGTDGYAEPGASPDPGGAADRQPPEVPGRVPELQGGGVSHRGRSLQGGDHVLRTPGRAVLLLFQHEPDPGQPGPAAAGVRVPGPGRGGRGAADPPPRRWKGNSGAR